MSSFRPGTPPSSRLAGSRQRTHFIALRLWPGGSRTHSLSGKQAASNGALGQRQPNESSEAGVPLGSCLWDRGALGLGLPSLRPRCPVRTPRTDVWRGHSLNLRGCPPKAHPRGRLPLGASRQVPRWPRGGMPTRGEAAAKDSAGSGQTTRRNEKPSTGF